MKADGKRKVAVRNTVPGARIVLALRAALCCLLFGSSPASAADDGARAPAVSDPATLKAAFLYNFALYTSWPPGAATGFALCAFGRDDLGPALDALAGKTVDGKPVQVRRVDSIGDARSCQLLYVSEATGASLASVARGLQGAPVLVVSDAAGAAEQAMIQIEPDASRLAFSVNLGRVRAAGLDVSARLLRLARSVR